MTKTFDEKLARIRANPGAAKDFILADAKDADMAGGLAATGVCPRTGRRRTLAEYREQMRLVVKQGLVDIMLMSCSTSELLTIRERLFDSSPVTPAARANDTTDIHLPTDGTYAREPSRPFASATIDHIMAGKLDPTPQERTRGATLGLYSITPNNRLEFDYPTLLAYRDFRHEAERKGFRHFLEVFDPNACGDHCPANLPAYINDVIARTLAGVPSAGRPQFLKIAYHGPAAMEALAGYDPTLVVGILGGASGTTFDAFHQLWEARKHGARAALYGRMINNSEDQLTFVQFLRWIADGVIDDPGEAVRAYHGALQKLSIAPRRPLAEDLQATRRATAYAGRTAVPVPRAAAPAGAAARVAGKPSTDCKCGGACCTGPAPAPTTAAERIAASRAKWDRILG
jgi:hypothetical protein